MIPVKTKEGVGGESTKKCCHRPKPSNVFLIAIGGGGALKWKENPYLSAWGPLEGGGEDSRRGIKNLYSAGSWERAKRGAQRRRGGVTGKRFKGSRRTMNKKKTKKKNKNPDRVFYMGEEGERQMKGWRSGLDQLVGS